MGKKPSTMTEAEAKKALTILGVDLRGKFGGPDSPFGDFVASRNRYGPYFRRRVVPTDRKSPGQLAQRSALRAVCPLWGSLLTEPQRETWRNARIKKTSKFGDPVALTGQAAWLFFNLLRHRIALPLILLPPTSKDAVILTPPGARLVVPLASVPLASRQCSLAHGQDARATGQEARATLTLRFAADAWNAPGGGVLLSGSAPLRPPNTWYRPFQTMVGLVHPGTGEWTIEYPCAVEEGDRVMLRFHVSAPSGRQSMVVLQEIAAE